MSNRSRSAPASLYSDQEEDSAPESPYSDQEDDFAPASPRSAQENGYALASRHVFIETFCYPAHPFRRMTPSDTALARYSRSPTQVFPLFPQYTRLPRELQCQIVEWAIRGSIAESNTTSVSFVKVGNSAKGRVLHLAERLLVNRFVYAECARLSQQDDIIKCATVGRSRTRMFEYESHLQVDYTKWVSRSRQSIAPVVRRG
ncbi:hypothetical protein EJ04DRAFT_555104 [Polyplosphaeria fusca]|uniref:Uncharacterized protein n=1 Tax=Polyplosphaeria fusca TaxID=682080 RepID=A0A9P4QTW4_9PLEO|nr:hypothetical protein EJ04DRAFT_555104 [Polyplosphaeria fusca]